VAGFFGKRRERLEKVPATPPVFLKCWTDPENNSHVTEKREDAIMWITLMKDV